MIERTTTLLTLTALTVALAAAPRAEDTGTTIAVTTGDTVPLTVIPTGVFLRVPDDPADDIWARVPEYGVELAPAPGVHRSVLLRQEAGADPLPLYFSVVSDRSRLYVRLRWNDSSRDVETRVDRFRDGAAVQFALADGEATSHMMGAPGQPVNIWYWRSDDGTAENLAAAGFGSTTTLPEQVVTAGAAYRAGSEWLVVLSRPLEANGDHVAAFEPGGTQPIAFAVWDGAEGQRDGHKRASTGWIHVDLAALDGG